MVKQILTLLIWTVVEGGFEIYLRTLIAREFYLLDRASCHIQGLEVLVGNHLSTSDTLEYQLRLTLQEVVFPKVGITLKWRLIVKSIAIGA